MDPAGCFQDRARFVIGLVYGRMLMENRQLTTIDLAEVHAHCRALAPKLATREENWKSASNEFVQLKAKSVGSNCPGFCPKIATWVSASTIIRVP